ncbi:hypothetical protein CDEF62S_00630 [Castellaniella defragrans]
MTTVTIERKTSSEENVSLRHVWYDILVDGQYVASRDDVCDALDLKEQLEKSQTN